MSQAVLEKSFQCHDVRGVSVIELTLPAEMDALEFDRLNAALLALVDGLTSRRVVLDLHGVDYMGSAVLGLMVNIRQHIKTARGKLVLCALSPRLFNIFQTCCLERLFTIAKTREEAMAKV